MKNLYYMNRQDIMMLGGRIAYDEEFRPIKGSAGLFVSNYGRIASKRQSDTRIVSTYLNRGYEFHATKVKKYGKVKNVHLRVHRVVAQAFIPIPLWIHEEDLTDLVVHHIVKVVRGARIKGINHVDNLVWLPRHIHNVLHSFEQIEIMIDGKYRRYNFLDACRKLRITPYDLVDVLQQPKEQEEYNYYSADVVRDDGTMLNVTIRHKK